MSTDELAVAVAVSAIDDRVVTKCLVCRSRRNDGLTVTPRQGSGQQFDYVVTILPVDQGSLIRFMVCASSLDDAARNVKKVP